MHVPEREVRLQAPWCAKVACELWGKSERVGRTAMHVPEQEVR
jgi:hypothetical protein